MGVIADISFSGGGLGNNDIRTNAGIAATKLVSRRSRDITIAGTTSAAVTGEELVHIGRASGSWISMEAIAVTKPTANRTLTIDLQKATSATTFATILTSTIELSTSTTNKVVSPAVFNNTAMADGDIWRASWTTGGTSGTNAKGVLLTLCYDENPS